MAQNPSRTPRLTPAQQRVQSARARSASVTAKQEGARGIVRRDPHAKMRPAGVRDWIGGARLRTLPLAIAPVLIGVGAAKVADGVGVWHPVRSALCLIVALALQIGVNYANDYSDGVRGTDAYRVGPSRLTGSGRAKPRTVLIVALSFFLIAAIAGVLIVFATHLWWLLAVGAVALVAAWFYTGGKRPYGYYGLGEVVVFVFFGLVATCGTTFVNTVYTNRSGSGLINQESLLGGVAAGLFACAVLLVNNMRDIDQDRLAGKRTLSVLIGRTPSKILFCLFVAVPFGILAVLALFYSAAWIGFFVLLAAIPACLIVVTGRSARELITALQLTSLSALAFAAILGAAYAF